MPSGKFHFGNKLIAELMAWYQQQGIKVYIPISDIEAHAVRGLELEKCKETALNEYILNYLALGVDLLDLRKAYIYSQWRNENVKNLAFRLSAKITAAHLQSLFGFSFIPSKENPVSDSMGKIFSPFIDAADILFPQLPEFGGPKPVLVPVGIDQDPYIRLCHDLAPKFAFIPPSSIYVKMMCGLQGPGAKMPSSKPETAIFLTDPPEEAERKLMASYTGGESIRKQKELGGKPEECVPYMFLLFHFEDEIVKRTFEECRSGALICGECKARVAERIRNFPKEHWLKMAQSRKLLPKIEELHPI